MIGGAADANIRAVITADDQASKTLGEFGGKIGSMAKVAGAALIGVGAAAAAMGVLSVKAFSDSEDRIAQTNAVLKSTGGIAGVTAEQVTKVATAFQKQTKFSDESVRSVENLLLTFTAINKNIFPQTTKVVLDMATALGEDTKSAAIQVGKALQDPILGITALRRVGVNFNDSQKEVIKNLVDTGQSAKAQQLILAELTREFGGSAEAAGNTFSGQLAKLKNSLNDVEESLGKAIVHGLTPFIAKAAEAVASIDWEKQINKAEANLKTYQANLALFFTAISGGTPEVQKNQEGFITLVTTLSRINTAFKNAVDGVQQLYKWFMNLTPVIIIGQFFQQVLWPALKDIAKAIKEDLAPAFEHLFQAYKRFWDAINPAFTDYLKILGAIILGGVLIWIGLWILAWEGLVRGGSFVINMIADVGGWIANLVKWFGNLVGVVWNAIKTIGDIFANLPAIIWDIDKTIMGIFAGFGRRILNSLGDFSGLLYNAGKDLIGGLVNGIQAAVGGIASAIGGGVKGALHAAHIPGFASGVTNFSGGLAMVGEQGPELVNLPSGSSVTPNNKLGGLGGDINITVQAGAFMGNPQDARQYAKLILNSLQDVASSKGMSFDQLWRHNGIRSI